MPARIKRGKPPVKPIKRHKYRDALPELFRDFGSRCAYSCQHYTRAGGESCMEVDHFDPRQKRDFIQDYRNLFLATRHCNLAKGKQWPTKADIAAGLRFLNPCEEMDYGEQILEDPISHKLVGLTPAAIWHIRKLNLNAEHLRMERHDRAEIWKDLRSAFTIKPRVSVDVVTTASATLQATVDRMIPEIPYLRP